VCVCARACARASREDERHVRLLSTHTQAPHTQGCVCEAVEDEFWFSRV